MFKHSRCFTLDEASKVPAAPIPKQLKEGASALPEGQLSEERCLRAAFLRPLTKYGDRSQDKNPFALLPISPCTMRERLVRTLAQFTLPAEDFVSFFPRLLLTICKRNSLSGRLSHLKLLASSKSLDVFSRLLTGKTSSIPRMTPPS